MKQIAILILGCLPLAVLTVESFRELAAVREELARPPDSEDTQTIARQCGRTREQAAAENVAAAATLQADLFAGEPVAALQSVEVDSPWKPAADRWLDWTRARALLRDVIEAEQTASRGGMHDLEAAADRFDALRKRFSGVPPRGSLPVLKLAAERTAELGAQIDRQRSKEELGVTLARARAEFQGGHYPLVIALCDKLLAAEHLGAITPDVAQKVRILKRRAQFGEDSDRLPGRVRMADSDAAQALILREFVDRYAGKEDLSPSETKELDRLRAQIRSLEGRSEGGAGVSAKRKP
jgi:hypothetical protein